MNMRTIASIGKAKVTRHGPGLLTRDVGEAELGASISPFIVVSLYDMTGPTFPPHPHAGFSVATYILPESAIGFVNQDSLGNVNAIAPGALHWTTAGSGMLHEEQPEREGSMAQGYQIWVDHANQDRQLKPDALHLLSSKVPKLELDGTIIRVVLGSSNGLTSPLKTPTAVRLIDVKLAPHAHFSQQLDEGENAFVILIDGDAMHESDILHAGDVASFGTSGGELSLIAGSQGARFTLFAGQPFTHSRAQRGPFVASDAQQLQEFMSRYSTGNFGYLKPIAEQPPIKLNSSIII